ncbi:hypothetical protein DQ04_01141080 [Trypanosoma grayi]|uniref:hypothetical protein n=1 Tax=Trypanosoma grayi TaxID=71804 RepID=UPI0004F47B1F|nr:hypothetical protein DQ04_01141080 [Trypanosoma grayi]KEG13222.1 hypothetical protein DQ04_01141080 [Trypanosoma grayi]
MLPWMMISSTVVFAALLLITALPPLYIYDPEKYPDEPMGPPTAGGIFPDSAMSHSVRQKLYILFVLPTCAFLNALYLYLAYYRHLRCIQFRVELSLVAHANFLMASRIIIQEHTRMQDSTSLIESGGYLRTTSLMNRSFFMKGENTEEMSAPHSIFNKLCRHARPDNISLHSYSTSPWHPELQELQGVVFTQFLRRADVARTTALNALQQHVLMDVDHENNLQDRSMHDALVHILEKHSTFINEAAMRTYLAQVQMTRRCEN